MSMQKYNFVKGDNQLLGEDIRDGMTAVVSVKIHEPQFEGQTKTKLGNSEARWAVENLVSEKLAAFLEENPDVSKKIIDKALLAAKAREEARKARELVIKRKSALDSSNLPGKLADCSEKTLKSARYSLLRVTLQVVLQNKDEIGVIRQSYRFGEKC